MWASKTYSFSKRVVSVDNRVNRIHIRKCFVYHIIGHELYSEIDEELLVNFRQVNDITSVVKKHCLETRCYLFINCSFVYSSICPSIQLPIHHPSTHPSTCPSVYLFFLFPTIYPFTHPSTYQSAIHLFICLSMHCNNNYRVLGIYSILS